MMYERMHKTVASVVLCAYLFALFPASVVAESVTKDVSDNRVEKRVSKTISSSGGILSLGEASIEIPEGALSEDKMIQIEHLSSVAKTGESLSNAIPQSKGYRFLPSGTQFEKTVIITLPYDRALNEKSQALEELYTYFYDTKKSAWIRLERLEVDTQACVVRSLTTHFTDMITATLTLPEMAGPVDVNLNSIKSLSAVTPDSHLIKFNRPQASNTGEANFSFDIGVPAGRQGMEASLRIQYSSAGANGIMGRGFDIHYGSSITSDTRFGLPHYDTYDTYMLDGVVLKEMRRMGAAIYYEPEKESNFRRIIRYGADTDADWWEVTDKTGRKSIYGKNEASCVGSAKNKFTWHIEMIVDARGNTVEFTYEKESGYVYPQAIYYTGRSTTGDSGNERGKYSIRFYYENERKDVRVDGRSRSVVRCNKLLRSITSCYKEKPIRTYSFTYKEDFAFVKQLTHFTVSNNAGESYEYTFDYTQEQKEGDKVRYFCEAKKWENGKPLYLGKGSNAGVSFNGSAGVGYGTSFVDGRVSAGLSGSFSFGGSYTEETLIDIDGDGRLDSIRQDGNIVYVALGNGIGFGETRAIVIDGFTGKLDYERARGSTKGWNVYGGIGSKNAIISGGVSYAEVEQESSLQTECSFMDVNRDGFVDIVVSGRTSYFRNTGNLNFVSTPFYTQVAVRDVIQQVSEEKAQEYRKTYYVQTPFRMWCSPYEGTVSIQEVASYADAYQTKGVKIYTHFSDEDARNFSFSVPCKTEQAQIGIEQGERVYFISDSQVDPKGLDIDWEVKLSYSHVKALKPLVKSPFFLEATTDADSKIQNKVYKQLVADEYILPRVYPSDVFESLCEDIRRHYSSWKDVLDFAQHFVYIVNDDIYVLQSESTEDCIDFYEKYSSSFTREIIKQAFHLFDVDGMTWKITPSGIIYSATGSEDVSKKMRSKNVAGSVYSDAEFTTHLLNIGTLVGIDGKEKNITYNFSDAKILVDGEESAKIQLKEGGAIGNPAHTFDLEVYKDDKDEVACEVRVVCKEKNNRATYIYIEEMDKLVRDFAVPYVDIYEDYWQWDEKKEEVRNPESKIRAVLGLSDEEVEEFIEYMYEKRTGIDYEIGEPVLDEKGKPVFEIIEKEYTYYVLKDEPNYAGAQEILSAYKYRYVTEELFPFYILSDGGYVLKDFWRDEKTEDEIFQMDFFTLRSALNIADGVLSMDSEKTRQKFYNIYLEKNTLLLSKCDEYRFETYGLLSYSVVYNTEYLYKIDKDSCYTLVILETGGKLVEEKRALRLGRHQWKTQTDYSAENLNEPLSLGKYIIPVTIDEEIENEEREIEVCTDEVLYGGVNNWYYGIWKGSLTENPFSTSAFTDFKYNAQQLTQEEFKERQTNPQNNTEVPEKMEVCFYLPHKADAEFFKMVDGLKKSADVSSLDVNLALLGTVALCMSETQQGVLEHGRYEYSMPYIEGSRIHSERSGSDAYYRIEGLYNAREADTQIFFEAQEMQLPSIRKTYTQGTDITSVEEVTIGPVDLSYIKNIDTLGESSYDVAVSLGKINAGENNSWSTSQQTIQDIDGDGLPDIVQIQDEKMCVTKGTLAENEKGAIVFKNPFIFLNDISYISKNKTKSTVLGGGISSVGSVKNKPLVSSLGNIKGVQQEFNCSVNPCCAVSYSNGESVQYTGFYDINGDGLLDFYDSNFFKINTGSGFTEVGNLFVGVKKPSISKTESIGLNFSLGIGMGRQNLLEASSLTSGISATIGMTYNCSSSTSEKVFLDINGDGLLDILEMESGNDTIDVQYNTGSGFQRGESIVLTSWGEIVSESNKHFLTQGDSSGFDISFLEGIPVFGSKIENDLANITINPFGAKATKYADSLDWNTSVGLGLNGNIGLNVNISIYVFIGTINITVAGGAGANASTTINGASVRMTDLDGDGLPDHVLRIPGVGTYWKRNLSGTYGQLRCIHLPQGGCVSLEYKEQYGTVACPQFKYVMSRVTVHDGCGEGMPAIEHGSHSITTEYEYRGAYYDREAKEFYGFEKVKTTYSDGSYAIDTYSVGSYYAKGVRLESFFYGIDGTLLSKVQTELCPSPYALIAKKSMWIYENTSDEEQYLHTIASYVYDEYGNCTQLTYDFGNTQSIRSEVRYDNTRIDKYIIGLPTEICIYDAEMKLLRKKQGLYNDYGELTELRTFYEPYRYAKNMLTYDTYGNIVSVSDSRGATTSYGYDSEVSMFVTKVSQSGMSTDTYTSAIDYNYDTQTKKTEIDYNGNTLSYVYDAWQRISEIRTKYDDEKGIPSVRYTYQTPEKHTDGTQESWYAITDNKVSFDCDNDTVIQTVVQVDGLGRAVRTAKTGHVYRGGVKETGWNVNGAIMYDCKGRVIQSGMSEFITGSLNALFATPSTMTELYTSYDYDEKDRVVKTVLPDGSVYTSDFIIEENTAVQKTTDPQANVAVKRSDSRGNIVEVRREDSDGTILSRVTYEYNALNELLKAIDPKENCVAVTYDMLGRRTTLESVDSGRQDFFYDESSNLIAEKTSVLREKNKQIEYVYDGLNRLVKIDYPDTEDTFYTYGGANVSDGSAGKIRFIIDASGTLEYAYGALGEVTKEIRTLNTHLNKTHKTVTAVMEYKSDYLGRMQHIVYPDGEKIIYGYDAGAQVVSVTGERNGHTFNYVNDIGYDEYGQRVYIEYGNGVKTEYTYDSARRWLSNIMTVNKWNEQFQNIEYTFDTVGNVLGYTNNCLTGLNGTKGLYSTSQSYSYDGLYQLIEVAGQTTYNPYASIDPEYKSNYKQTFTFDTHGMGNMMSKVSTETVSPRKPIGDDLNYSLAYTYDDAYAHRLRNVGNRYYKYDSNGNIVCEQDGAFNETTEEYHREFKKEAEDIYSVNYGWGLFKDSPTGSSSNMTTYRRMYTWNERNQLISSVDSSYSTFYIYGQDGQRTNKYTDFSETLYFNKMWTHHTDTGNSVYGGQTAKNIYLGETRIVTKLNSVKDPTYQEEYYKQYFYHSDHLGSAHFITDYKGDEYQRIEYTPYGETWVEKTTNTGLAFLPYKFTGKELDPETRLYYYGARYMDPKYCRWLSADPALGEYIPGAPVNEEAKKRNGNLPGMGGVFNTVNLHLYHYAGNNPVKYVDPDGRFSIPRSYWNNFTMATMSDLVAANGSSHCNELVPRFLTGLGDKVFNDIIPSGNPNANALFSAWSKNENLVNLNDLVAKSNFDNVNTQEMAAEIANSYANEGYLVLAAADNGGGHVAIVAPQDQKFDSIPSLAEFTGSGKDAHQGRSEPTVTRDYPVFLQAGTYTGRVPPGYAFNRLMFDEGDVIFFVYKPKGE